MAGLEDYLSRPGVNYDGLDQGFQSRLLALFQAVPPEIGRAVMFSGYRSVAEQTILWNNEVADQGGNEAAARKNVAPPGKSNHNHGLATDLHFTTPAAEKWVHENAARFGLNVPMDHEPWHIEPIGVRSGSYNGQGIDPEAYTDGLGLTPEDNFSAKTHLLRMADMMNRTMSDPNGFRRGVDADPIAAGQRNTKDILQDG